MRVDRWGSARAYLGTHRVLARTAGAANTGILNTRRPEKEAAVPPGLASADR